MCYIVVQDSISQLCILLQMNSISDHEDEIFDAEPSVVLGKGEAEQTVSTAMQNHYFFSAFACPS
jgi:hypothetical protein